jgi:hypothetical protein
LDRFTKDAICGLKWLSILGCDGAEETVTVMSDGSWREVGC